MSLHVVHHTVELDAPRQFTDLSIELEAFVGSKLSPNANGLVTIYSRHTTACVRILENEILSLYDIQNHLEKVAPSDAVYLHDNLSLRQVPPGERVNGVSHVRSLYFNHSETIPVVDGNLVFGAWQSVFLIDLDPTRPRKVMFMFVGNNDY